MREIELNGNVYRGIPKPVRQQCVWVIRDYDRLSKLAKLGVEHSRFGPYEIVLYGDEKRGLIPASVVENAMFKVNCINLAMEDIPVEYRRGVLSNIMTHEKFSDHADRKTWVRWRDKFIKNLAIKLELR